MFDLHTNQSPRMRAVGTWARIRAMNALKIDRRSAPGLLNVNRVMCKGRCKILEWGSNLDTKRGGGGRALGPILKSLHRRTKKRGGGQPLILNLHSRGDRDGHPTDEVTFSPWFYFGVLHYYNSQN